MVEAARSFAAAEGLRFFAAETLAPARPDPNSAGTRPFHERVGFVPIEVVPTLLGAADPCLLPIRDV